MRSQAPPHPRFLALVGPTASGKSELSLRLAQALDGEIISMDSRQVYRGMEIGTDKVPPAARMAVPHHGLDRVDPHQGYSAARFAREARGWIQEIEGRGRVPLLVGGTGFFLKALLEPVFREPRVDPERRRLVREYLRELPRPQLERWVEVLDPDRSPVARAGGRQRLSRTVEVPLLTGRSLTWWHENAPPDQPPTSGMVVLLHLPREVLYQRINRRAQAMLESGLHEEVRGLLEQGYGPGDPGMSGTGYREVIRWIRGELSRNEVLDGIRRATRRYARRQLTWFRNQLPPDTLHVHGTDDPERLVGEIRREWTARRSPEGVGGTEGPPLGSTRGDGHGTSNGEGGT